MANRRFQDVQSLQRETKIITGVVGDGVASLPTGIKTAGASGSDLTIVLDDKYNDSATHGIHNYLSSNFRATMAPLNNPYHNDKNFKYTKIVIPMDDKTVLKCRIENSEKKNYLKQ